MNNSPHRSPYHIKSFDTLQPNLPFQGWLANFYNAGAIFNLLKLQANDATFSAVCESNPLFSMVVMILSDSNFAIWVKQRSDASCCGERELLFLLLLLLLFYSIRLWVLMTRRC